MEAREIPVTGMERNGTEIPVIGTERNGMYCWNPTYGITYEIPFRSSGIWTEWNGKLVPDNGTGYNPKYFITVGKVYVKLFSSSFIYP